MDLITRTRDMHLCSIKRTIEIKFPIPISALINLLKIISEQARQRLLTNFHHKARRRDQTHRSTENVMDHHNLAAMANILTVNPDGMSMAITTKVDHLSPPEVHRSFLHVQDHTQQQRLPTSIPHLFLQPIPKRHL